MQRTYVIPADQLTPYQHLMLWSRKNKLFTYRRLAVGSAIYNYLLYRIHPSKVVEGVIYWGRHEFVLTGHHPLAVEPITTA